MPAESDHHAARSAAVGARTCAGCIASDKAEAARHAAHTGACVARCIRCGCRAPEIERRRTGGGGQRRIAPACAMQAIERLGCLRRLIRRVQHAARVQRGATRYPGRRHRALHARERGCVESRIGQCARQQQGSLGCVIVERTAQRRYVDIRGECHDAGKHFRIIQCGCLQHCTGAIRQSCGDDLRVLHSEWRELRKRAIKHRQSESRRLQHVAAPVRFGIVAGVGVLDRDAGFPPGGFRSELEFGAADARLRAVKPRAETRGCVEVAAACTLVRVGDGTAARQTPRAGECDRTVDTARAGGCRDDEATRPRIECIGNLYEYAMWPSCAGDSCERLVFATRHADSTAVQGAVGAKRTKVGDALPVRLDRTAAQLRRGGHFDVRERRRRSAQSSQPKACAQQVIVVAMLALAYCARQEIGRQGFSLHRFLRHCICAGAEPRRDLQLCSAPPRCAQSA